MNVYTLLLLGLVLFEVQPKYNVEFDRDLPTEITEMICTNFSKSEIIEIKNAGGVYIQFDIEVKSKEVVEISFSEHAEGYLTQIGKRRMSPELKSKILLDILELNIEVANVDRFPESDKEETIQRVILITRGEEICF
ncbi:MAG: hypothetical protein RIC80_22710 [Cyclobacteriaceae bacterium]